MLRCKYLQRYRSRLCTLSENSSDIPFNLSKLRTDSIADQTVRELNDSGPRPKVTDSVRIGSLHTQINLQVPDALVALSALYLRR